MPPTPDFPHLLAEAHANHALVPLPMARRLLGDYFDDYDLDQYSLVMWPDGDIALTPTSWVRLILRAQDLSIRLSRPIP